MTIMESFSRLWFYSPGLLILGVLLLGFFSYQLGAALMVDDEPDYGP